MTIAFAPLAALSSSAQTRDLLKNDALESFRAVKGWRGVAAVSAVPDKTELRTSGAGRIVVNGSTSTEPAPYLLTKEDYGDVRVELEFMIPKGANAGVYLMGRYEVQILDSFGKTKTLGGGDMGGIYQRWDETRPQGQQGFGGIPPKTNASKAPGEWQTFDIIFRAPKFDAAGKKLSDATFEKVLVNRVLVQENASTTGPTRSAPLKGEDAKGPVAIQGDHGPIAIRRFRVTPIANAGTARLQELDAYWAEVSRAVRTGDFEAYKATCHEEGILVSGTKKTSQPLAEALARWKQDFVNTKAGTVKGTVEFRFSQRLGDRTTAHETGIFLYTSETPGEVPRKEYVHFEGLLTRTPEGWKILMEYQKSSATRAEWDQLPSAGDPIGKSPPAAIPVQQLQADFRKLEFGMFLHYNMATYTGDEWVQGYPDPSTFDPGGPVDTDAWADAAVSAGMKYGVLTAKHVGGFCLWDSKYTTYDIMHPECPYRQDLVAQFIESFKSRGLKAGLYYCWRHPGFGEPGKHKVLPPECDPATHSLEEQNKFQLAQLAELVEKYPDVFYIWNDGLDDKVMPADEVLTRLRSIRPDVLTSSNWWDWGKKGTPYADIAVKEMRPFPETNTAPGETCRKLEQAWFWKEGFRAGSADSILAHMATAHAANSNFLLNVGPDKKGRISESSIRVLAEIGKRP